MSTDRPWDALDNNVLMFPDSTRGRIFPRSLKEWNRREPFFEPIYQSLRTGLRGSTRQERAPFVDALGGPIHHEESIASVGHLAMSQNLETSYGSNNYCFLWLTYSHEKIMPALRLGEERGWLPPNGTALVDDMMDDVFYTARNAIAHWNFSCEVNRIRLFNRLPDKTGYDYIEWTAAEFILAAQGCKGAAFVVHLAVRDAIEDWSRN